MTLEILAFRPHFSACTVQFLEQNKSVHGGLNAFHSHFAMQNIKIRHPNSNPYYIPAANVSSKLMFYHPVWMRPTAEDLSTMPAFTAQQYSSMPRNVEM